MRNTLLIVSLLFCITVQAQHKILPKDTATIRFDNTFRDMGEVKINTQAEHTFMFTNTSKHPVFIIRAQSSGSCAIVSDYTKDPVLPGQQGMVKVIINCGFEGSMRKMFTITFNSESTPVILTLKAFLVKEETAPVVEPSQK